MKVGIHLDYKDADDRPVIDALRAVSLPEQVYDHAAKECDVIRQLAIIKSQGPFFFTLDRLRATRLAYLRLFFACEQVGLDLSEAERCQQVLRVALRHLHHTLDLLNSGHRIGGSLRVLALAIGEGVVGDEALQKRSGLTAEEYGIYFPVIEGLMLKASEEWGGSFLTQTALVRAVRQTLAARTWPEE